MVIEDALGIIAAILYTMRRNDQPLLPVTAAALELAQKLDKLREARNPPAAQTEHSGQAVENAAGIAFPNSAPHEFKRCPLCSPVLRHCAYCQHPQNHAIHGWTGK